ncbi:hypothetical protein [Tardiphaga robiniae]|uniref:Uncharacterized protein n=1 Tax=Tardiphaga robiniae TaxID=943830 RepID=A0A7G6U3S1_9BRAD|nr:hypothetical protein [Tardiphaga robiniae]QND73653.1 hypothetical protein HB776_22450 [Tardiphaga robiniae]
MSSIMNFVELHRAFAPLGRDQEPSLDLGSLWGSRLGGWLTWPKLTQRRRVILLAEASSGKSEEFRNQCEILKTNGEAAFFLRIEELAEQGFEAALDAGSAAAFEAWKAGSVDGWFFLDSVDEARLNRKNFDAALKRFASELGSALERAHVYISCRVTDWKGPDDRAVVTRWLPAWKKPVTAPASAEPSDSGLLDPVFDRKSKPRADKPEDDEATLNALLVVQLVPLSIDQYKTLAAAAGVADVGKFVVALQKHGLEAFAERPGDLLDLADYWTSNGKFGTFAEMAEHGITRKLREPDAFRPDNEALSLEKAREGAERVAGALTFGKSFTLRAAGHDPDPSLAAGALDPTEVLSDWTDAQRNALLRRGLFAPSTYGRVRFHHRSTQEYLSAKWLDGLLRVNLPRAEMRQLLFADRYGVKTVVPSLRPAAAWLSLWNPDIRDEVIKREPLTLLRHGDPGSLPIAVREQLLAAYASKQAAGDISDDRLEPRALWMFANEGLANAIKKAWIANGRKDFQFDMLRLIREGAIKDAVSLAAKVALDPAADEYHRIVALDACSACGDIPTLKAIAKALVAKPEKATAQFAAASTLALYPQFLKTSDVVSIVARSIPAKRHTAGGFAYQLCQLCDAAPDRAARSELILGLANLCLTKPFVADYQHVSKRFFEIAGHLHELVRPDVMQLGTAEPPPYLIRALMVVERAGRKSYTTEEEPKLYELVWANALLCRRLLWADAEEFRRSGRADRIPTRFWQINFSENASLWHLSQRDLPWLFDDLAARSHIDDRRIALSAILDILEKDGLLVAETPRLRALTTGNAVLDVDLTEYLTPRREDPELRRFRLDDAARKLEHQKQTAADKASWVEFKAQLEAKPPLLSDPANLTSWAAGIFRLKHLTHWLTQRTGSDYPKAALEWRLLEEGFNREVAEAYRDGMKAVWRALKPMRVKRTAGAAISVKFTTILAFSGVGVEAAEDADWTLHLSDAEVKLAAKHGCHSAQGYPEWLDALVSSYPKLVLPIVQQQITREWNAPPGTPTSFLYHYGMPANALQQPLQKILFDIILKTEPVGTVGMDTGLRIIRHIELDASRKQQLRAMAKTRLAVHVKANNVDFALRYLAIHLLADANAAIGEIRKWLNAAKKAADRKARAEKTFGALFDRHDPLAPFALRQASVASLEALLSLAYSYVRPQDDAVHEGTYSPDARDNAEGARDSILSALLDRPGADAFRAMERISANPVFALRAHRFRELTRGKAERDAEIPAWSVAEVLTFQRQFTAPVKTGSDLLTLVLNVLNDIAFTLTGADASSRKLLERARDEDEVQNWLGEQMMLRAKGRFHTYREAEVAGGNMPDIVVASTTAPVEVAIEIKHGGMGWTARQLDDALRSQLAQDYLKPPSRRHGVLVITHHRDRRWYAIDTTTRITFTELISWLQSIAATLHDNDVGAIEVACVGLNAWKDTEEAVAKKPRGGAKKKIAPKRKPSKKRALKK